MEAGIVELKNRGMFRDASISKDVNEFAFYNKNIRITSVDNNNTVLSVTNEKGTSLVNVDLSYKKTLNKISYNKDSGSIKLEHSLRGNDDSIDISCKYIVDEPDVTVSLYNYINNRNYIEIGGRKYYYNRVVDGIRFNGTYIDSSDVSLWICDENDELTATPKVYALKTNDNRPYPELSDIRDNPHGIINSYCGFGDLKLRTQTHGTIILYYIDIDAMNGYQSNDFWYSDIITPISDYKYGYTKIYDNGSKDYIFEETNSYSQYKLIIYTGQDGISTKFPYYPINGEPEFKLFIAGESNSTIDVTNNLSEIVAEFSDGVIVPSEEMTSSDYSLDDDTYAGTNRCRTEIIHINKDLSSKNININYEPYSILLSQRENNDFVFYVNGEQVPQVEQQTIYSIYGYYIGHCIINNYLVLFTTYGDGRDYIYKIDFNDENNVVGELLYTGNLNFSFENPIETLACYESENIQKVYWVDGKNQPRVINIMSNSNYGSSNNGFDFCCGVNKLPIVNIEKEYNGSGMFNSGTIQYYITYYKKFGQESHIVYSSPINYISAKERGFKADETSTCSFKIVINNIDSDNFNYLRVYSAKRSSKNGAIELQIVGDYNISNIDELTVIDNNINQEAVDANLLYFIGGKEFIAGTIDQKNNTAFFGDLMLTTTTISSELQNYIDSRIDKDGNYYESLDIVFERKRQESQDLVGYYSYRNNMESSDDKFKTYKYGEYYRFAIQFITKTGEALQPLWIGDKFCDIRPEYDEENNCFYVPNAIYKWNNNLNNLTKDYIGYKLLIAETSPLTRQIVAQGIVNPTMFNYLERYTNSPYSIASWNFRPKNGDIPSGHFYPLNKYTEDNAELQGLKELKIPFFNDIVYSENHYKYRLILLGADEGHVVSFRIVYFNDYSYNKIGDERNDRLLRIFSGITENDTEQALFDKVLQNAPDITDYKVVTFFSNDPGGDVINYNTITYNKKYMDNGVINTSSWKVTQNALMRAFSLVGINPNIILEEKELKNIANKSDNNRGLIFAWIGFAVAVAAAVVASVFTFGAAASITPALVAAGTAIAGFAGITTLSGVAAVSAASIACSAIALGAGANAAALQVESKTKEWQKSILGKGWFEFGEGRQQTSELRTDWDVNKFLSLWFHEFPEHRMFYMNDFGNKGYINKVKFYCNISCLTHQSDMYGDAESKFNQYYIDNSIVTFNSPELESNQDIIDNSDGLEFRIIGTIPINANYGSYLINTDNSGLSTSSETIFGEQFGSPINGSSTTSQNNNNSLQCGFLYQDNRIPNDKSITNIIATDSLDAYKVFLWNRDTSLSLGSASNINYLASANNPLTRPIANLGRKVFANQLYSIGTNYFKNRYSWSPSNGIDYPQIFNSDEITIKQFNHYSDKKFYYGNYDHIISFKENEYYRILSKFNTEESYGDSQNWRVYDPIHIKYKSTPHALIKFKPDSYSQSILPVVSSKEYSTTFFGDSEIFGDNAISDKYSYDVIGYNNQNVLNNVYLLGDSSSASAEPIRLNLDYVRIITSLDENNEGIEITLNQDFLEKACNNYSSGADSEIIDIISQYRLGIICYLTRSDIASVYYFSRIENGIYYGYRPKSGINESIKQAILNKNGNSIGISLAGAIWDVNDSTSIACRNFSVDFIESNLLDLSQGNVEQTGAPYLYMGELYKKNFNPKDIYSGIEPTQLQRLNWIPCSLICDVGNDVNITWGDSYYQRWDCLKSYPFTENDTNSIVDICSCMIESHINLDGRCDVNRGIQNIVNARPTNWNIYNDAYNQQDNIFKFNILDEKYNLDIYPNQIAWSLTKSPTETIDTWTNINMANVLNLDGRYGKVNKVININDTIVAFQDKAIASIMFNDRHQITTTSGVPIEIANSGKVDGYNYITTNYGCHNKWSIVKAASGIYFIDDLNKSFMSYSKDGLSDISANGFINWFKENINGEIWAPTISRSRNMAFKNAYDSITKDIYIINKDICLLYNEQLRSFTSFMDYTDVPLLFNIKGESYVVSLDSGDEQIYKMFSGDYNEILYNRYINYEIQYKINPEPYIDKTFTNIEFIADCLSPNVKIDNPYGTDNIITERPFNKLKVWNEYQYGESNMNMTQQPSDLKRKFRIFRNDIPRDSNSNHGLDRIRNPWIYLSLLGDVSEYNDKNFKMVFHNTTVKYFK